MSADDMERARIALRRGAEYVATTLAAVRAEEREACAQIVDGIVSDIRAGARQVAFEGDLAGAKNLTCDADNLERVAKHIRARRN